MPWRTYLLGFHLDVEADFGVELAIELAAPHQRSDVAA